MTRDALVARVRDVLTPDLLHPAYRHNPKAFCYPAAEALYHLLGGKAAGYTPHTLKHEGGTHWFLKHADGSIIDPTADQFSTPPPYHAAAGRGFLTARPSKRARTIMQRIAMHQPDIAERLIDAARDGTFEDVLAELCEDQWISKATDKPSFREGQLHRDLYVAQGQKIPVAKMRAAAKRGDPEVRRRAQFALNATGH